MRSAITVSLVPEVRGGPFVYWDDLATSGREAQRLGYDALEVFPRSAAEIPVAELRRVLSEEGLSLAALGTGAGWVVHKLRLTDPDAEVRRKAVEFVSDIARVAGEFGAAVIIGSMQGRIDPGTPRDTALQWLCDGVAAIARVAEAGGGLVLLEPLNRYETNVLTSVADSAALVRRMGIGHVRLLCDLFHMNIEEANIADSLIDAAETVGHIHFADTNRCAIGLGHLDVPPIIQALRKISYTGYLSAEVFPLPSEAAAAEMTIQSFRKFVT